MVRVRMKLQGVVEIRAYWWVVTVIHGELERREK